jgi:ribosomal protein L30/L7E
LCQHKLLWVTWRWCTTNEYYLRLRVFLTQTQTSSLRHIRINSHSQSFSAPPSHAPTEVSTQTAASRTVAALAASPPPPSSVVEPKTHSRIALRRSGISLGKRVQGTLSALGLRRRMQTVYHPHTPEAAGMILAVKELVEMQNVCQCSTDGRAAESGTQGSAWVYCCWVEGRGGMTAQDTRSVPRMYMLLLQATSGVWWTSS